MSGALVILAVIGYLAVAVFAWTHIYRWLYRRHGRDFPTLTWRNDDRMFGIAWGGIVAAFWPISGPIMCIGWLLGRAARSGLLERALGLLERALGRLEREDRQ